MERAKTAKTIAVGTSHAPGGTHRFEEPKLNANDVDPLGAAPAAAATVFKAVRSGKLETATCSRPFADASVHKLVVPAYPPALRTSLISGWTGIAVAINGDGSLIDSWVWAPSAVDPFDSAALNAVHQSTFVGAIAYCKPVPALYNYFILFDSR